MVLSTLTSDSLIHSIKFTNNDKDLVGACQGGIIMWDAFDGVNNRYMPGEATFCVDVSPKDSIFATVSDWNQDSRRNVNTLGE